MSIWIVIGFMTIGVVAAFLIPMIRHRHDAGQSQYAANEVEVYRDQLSEVDRDLANGLIGEAEAEAARAEIARRLLVASEAAEAKASEQQKRARGHKVMAAIVAVLIPAISIPAYLSLGHPEYPDQPLTLANAKREQIRQSQARNGKDIASLIKKVEDALRQRPDDIRGWRSIAPVYLKMQNREKAIHAFTQIARLTGSAAAYADIGEVHVSFDKGAVKQDAMAAFEKALEVDPKIVKARFFVALSHMQTKDFAAAIKGWESLMADAPSAGAPWLDTVKEYRRQAYSALGKTMPASAGKNERTAAKGPTASDVKAAAQMSVEDRQAMIVGMVESLAEKLKDNPKDLKGWVRLIRAYTVLKKTDTAKTALAEARKHFADKADALSTLQNAAKASGLE